MKNFFLSLGLITLVVSAIFTVRTTTFAAPATHAATAPALKLVPSCSEAPVESVRCMAIRVVPPDGTASTNGPSGFGPVDLRSAYNLATTGGNNKTIAIVDAFDDPNAEADLAVYRSQFGLPPCTTANGCFRKVNQDAGTNYPRSDGRWAEEISLDLDMVSAICPNCHILLVEAQNANLRNLGKAVDTAVSLGATAVSNSYGGSDFPQEVALYGEYYNHAGVAITASTGDNGFGTQIPASFNTVIAVGGTTLVRNPGTSRGWSESAWAGSGSGCSAYATKQVWQTDPGCDHRSIADVSAVADPHTGVAVFDTFGYSGWLVFGGTSISAPIIASIYALAGNAAQINPGAYLYSHANSLNDISAGANGSCANAYLCVAQLGYDGPTGLGTPNGTLAF